MCKRGHVQAKVAQFFLEKYIFMVYFDCDSFVTLFDINV